MQSLIVPKERQHMSNPKCVVCKDTGINGRFDFACDFCDLGTIKGMELPVDTSKMPECVTATYKAPRDVKEFGASIVDRWKKGEVKSIEWVMSRVADLDYDNQFHSGGLRLEARYQMNRRNKSIDLLRKQIKELGATPIC